MKLNILRSICFLSLCLTIYSCSSNKEVPLEKIEISGQWQFAELGSKEWLPAKVPGTVHSDLLTNKKIEWPYYGKNEQDLAWIEKKEWEYKTEFTITEQQLQNENLDLVFEGIDTYADVYLNDSLIKSVDNMFVAWEIACKKYLKKGSNNLRLHFKSALNITMAQLKANKYLIPCANEYAPDSLRSNVFARKAPYHWGWDWGPRIVTCGIWRPVYIQAWNNAKINDVFYITDSIGKEKASLKAKVELSSSKTVNADVQVKVDGKLVATQNIKLNQGKNDIELMFEIEQPELWWTLGLGNQKLYNIETELILNKKVISNKSRKTGLRKLELITSADSLGNNFYFKLNGHPLFIKGSNYIPADNILTDVSPERYAKVIKAATDAHMNMLRVWGGAIYENDLFYDLCDEKGILVWQDFMFACSMIPSGKAHIDNIEQEFRYNIKRLRNHASMALWCGNNENMVAWRGWGWQKEFRLTPPDSLELMDTYKKIFHEMLPKVTNELDGTHTYWPTSPGGGFNLEDEQSPKSGDVHDWRIWFSKTSFETITSVKHRFVSEYGLQAFPEMKTIQSFATEKDMAYDSELFDYKQRSKMPWIGKDDKGNVFNGNDMLKTYTEMYYKKPKTFKHAVYLSQLTQAEGLKYIIKGHRSHKPYCWGSMYWQIDDCWPTVSWATMDYYYRWKAGHYFVRDSYKPVITNAVIDPQKNVQLQVLSDALNDISGYIKYSLIEFGGKVVYTDSVPYTAPANSSYVALSKSLKEMLKNANPKNTLLYIELYQNKALIDQDILYFDLIKNISLPAKPTLNKEINATAEGVEIILSSSALVKNVCLSTEKLEGFFSNNYIDIVPGKPVRITFDGTKDMKAFAEDLKIMSVADTY